MSSTGLLIVILAIWLVLNADKLAWVFMGHLKLDTTGYQMKRVDASAGQ